MPPLAQRSQKVCLSQKPPVRGSRSDTVSATPPSGEPSVRFRWIPSPDSAGHAVTASVACGAPTMRDAESTAPRRTASTIARLVDGVIPKSSATTSTRARTSFFDPAFMFLDTSRNRRVIAHKKKGHMSANHALPFRMSRASCRKGKILLRELALVVHAAALAKGSYGQFHRGVLGCTGTVGVKSVYMPFVDDEESVQNWTAAVHEIALLRAMSKCSRRVVHAIHAVYAHNIGTMYIVTEMCRMDLRQYIRNGHARRVNREYPDAMKSWSRHMTEMLGVLRAFRTIHMDIKPENILVDEHCKLKLCDFGLARFFARDASPWISERVAYTRWYRPPQVCVRRRYSYGADTWAMGCVLYELADAVFAKWPTYAPLFGGTTSLLTATVPNDGCPVSLVEEGEIVERVSVTMSPTMQIVCIYKTIAPAACMSSVIDVTRMDDVRESRKVTPSDIWPNDILSLCRRMCRFHEKDRLRVDPALYPSQEALATLEHTLAVTAPNIQEVAKSAMTGHSA